MVKLVCSCGFDTNNHHSVEEADKELKKISARAWYTDDYENRCPQCGSNSLKAVKN